MKINRQSVASSWPRWGQRQVWLLFALLVLVSCSTTEQADRQEQAAPAAAPDVVQIDQSAVDAGRVSVTKVVAMPFPEIVQVSGRIGTDENRTVRVGAIAEGRIAEVKANAGDRVTKGQKLAEMHSYQVHEYRAQYARALAGLDRSQAELEFSRNARDRAQRLLNLRAASLEQVQRAQTDFRAAELEVAAARAEVGRIEEQLHNLGISPESAKEEYGEGFKPGKYEEEELIPVSSPIAGVVLERLVSPGTVVSSASDLFRISDLSNLWVHAEVPEKYLGKLREGLPVKITVQAYPNETFPARISRVGDTLDPDTRTVQVRCEADNVRMKLKPEMYASITFELEAEATSLVVPTGAIQEVNGEQVVFVSEEPGRFRLRKVTVGRQADGRSEILVGLRDGEPVATTGSFLLKSELLKGLMAEE